VWSIIFAIRQLTVVLLDLASSEVILSAGVLDSPKNSHAFRNWAQRAAREV
jgi:hypothetical protein